MKKIVAVAALALLAAASPARAQERAGDAALGALSGALVLGPIGAVAGAVVGFTTGPSIARAWGLRSAPPQPVRATKRTSAPPRQQTSARAASDVGQARAQDITPRPAAKPPADRRDAKMPPMQAFE